MTLNLGILSRQTYQLEQQHKTLQWNKISLCGKATRKRNDKAPVDSKPKEKSDSEWRRHRHFEAGLKT